MREEGGNISVEVSVRYLLGALRLASRLSAMAGYGAAVEGRVRGPHACIGVRILKQRINRLGADDVWVFVCFARWLEKEYPWLEDILFLPWPPVCPSEPQRRGVARTLTTSLRFVQHLFNFKSIRVVHRDESSSSENS